MSRQERFLANRRRFLRQAMAIPVAQASSRGATLSLLGAGSLASLTSTANAAECSADYRSLVCVFLAGGADSFNIFVPVDSRYGDYQASRQDLAVSEADLLGVASSAQGEFGFHRLVEGLHSQYSTGRLAVVSNVGPLRKPTTQDDYRRQREIPESLFAHDAQQRLWQTAAISVSGADSDGWGGSLSAALSQCNAGAVIDGAFSMAGSNRYQNAPDARYIRLNPNVNVERLYGYDDTVATWIPEASRTATSAMLKQLSTNGMSASSPTMLRAASASLAGADSATVALGDALSTYTQDTWEPDALNKLETQLHLVARLIQSREILGQRRQMFFVNMGGWDTHSNQNERLPLLLGELNSALMNFQNAIDEMNVAQTVTSFTASDFGRTLTSNGNGTDHGWGGHGFVMGGAVQGGQVVGNIPDYASVDNPDDAGDAGGQFAGRLIPTLSVNQYGATLSRWMGANDSEISRIFPDLANFDVQDLGFMRG